MSQPDSKKQKIWDLREAARLCVADYTLGGKRGGVAQLEAAGFERRGLPPQALEVEGCGFDSNAVPPSLDTADAESQTYPMLRNSASGPEIGFPGRILDRF